MSSFRTYDAVAYKQIPHHDAPWLVLFVASAEELLSWAGIPQRATTDGLGFQRVEDAARIQQTKEFFGLPPNQSPTALIVGIHKPPPGSQPEISLIFGDAAAAQSNPTNPHACRLVVHDDPSRRSLDMATARLKAQILGRVAPEPTEPEVTEDSEEETAEQEVDEELENDDQESSKALQLAHSVLPTILKQLESADWVAEHERSIREMAMPASIIDGQHRVRGAAACERNVPFAVCAMFECPWPEQVFQFTVVNYTAKGIPDQFITANAALSLTEGELRRLHTRLVQARVKVVEYELMKVVNFDRDSPFFELVNLSDKKSPTKIGYKTMVSVASDWHSARKDSVLKAQLLPALYPDIKGKGATTQRLTKWQDATWGLFFIDFWSVVRDHYLPHQYVANPTASEQDHKKSSLWSVGSQLLQAVVLLEFQRQFLADLSGQDDEWFEVPEGQDALKFFRAKLRQRASKFLEFFPAQFFSTKWGLPSLNISSGRRALKGALEKLRTTKGRYQYAKSALVTGEIS